MDNGVFWELAAIFVLILANGFFSLSEFSLIASRKSRLRRMANEGLAGAETASRLHQRPERFLASVQIGITLVATLAGVVGGATLVNALEIWLSGLEWSFVASASGPIALGLVTVFITVVTVVLGELVPKYIALSHPESYARRVAGPMALFTRLTAFFSRSLTWAARTILGILGVRTDRTPAGVTEEEINLMIYEGKQRGDFDEIEERLVRSAFSFADSNVRRAMTPRTEVVGIEINSPPSEIIRLIIEEGYSRYPIYEGNLDHIAGILYTKDIIIHKVKPEQVSLKDLIRKPLLVPGSMPLSKLLNLFQKKKRHIAIVLDEYGGTEGIITLEDVLEELVGEIRDEYDQEQAPLVRHSDTVAFAEGSVWPGAINQLMHANLPEDKADTIAGLFIDHLGHIPDDNETATINDLTISVLEREDNRLVRLKIEKTSGKKEELSGK